MAARLLEAGFLKKLHLHGAGNGILTIARGTVPLAVFGSENYGYRLGVLGAPARIMQAGAPLAFSVLIAAYGANVLLFTSALCRPSFLRCWRRCSSMAIWRWIWT